MKVQIHLSFSPRARRGAARSNICHRDCPWPCLLLAGCCAMLVGLAWPTRAAVTEAWVQRYSNVVSNANDQAFKVVSDAAGDMIVTGTTHDGSTGQDFLMIKYSGADGSVLWQKRSTDPATAVAVDGSRNVVVMGSSAMIKYLADGTGVWTNNSSATALAVDGSGNVLAIGFSDGGFFTAKYAAADGALLWEKRATNFAKTVVVDSSGNAVVSGYTLRHLGPGLGNFVGDYYIAKFAAADGTLLWEKSYIGPLYNNDFAQGLAVDGSGNVVVLGPSNNATNSGVYTTKYAGLSGAVLWEKPYNGPGVGDGYAHRVVVVDGNGNVVVTGNVVVSGFNYDYYTAKYAAADGALLWEKQYNGPGDSHDSAQALAVDGNGNVVVTGFSYSSEDYGSGDYYTVKYAAADGALLWEKRYNGPANDHDSAQGLTVDASGNVVVAGSSATGRFAGSEFISDFYTAKYASADGALLWEKRYNGLASSDGNGRAVVLDSSGNVVVTGNSIGSGLNSDYYTAKYAAANGALLWEKRYNGPGDGVDEAHTVVVDGSDNVVVTGFSRNSSGNDDYYTAKYAATDGALLWEKRYNGTGNRDDHAQAIAMDGNGNVVVTGYSSGTSGSDNDRDDYYTAKYAAADGTLLWEKRYNGTGNRDDHAQALAMDGSGNVVVTGYSGGSPGNADYYTAKYAAADGALLWSKRYNGAGFGSDQDYASAVAVDGSGNVVVTGYSYNGASNLDYYTAKYAAANGALLWEKRYNGPGNHHDRAQAVAVDGNGNVVVTGMSGYWWGGGGEQGRVDNYYTAKYAAADGALLWEKRFDPANFGRAQAVAVDDSGNVVVTGTSYDSGSGTDYYTAKYAAVDGALLWDKRYNGPADVDDFMVFNSSFNNEVFSSRNLAIGPDGRVAITGSSGRDNSGIAYNYATVLYREDLPPVTITLVPTGIRLRFNGVPGRSYRIERAPAVTGPWSILETPTAPSDGIIEYVDINPPSGTAFYRTSTP